MKSDLSIAYRGVSVNAFVINNAMPNTNQYFNNFSHRGEQNLIEDLIIESVKIYGIEIQYLPRTIVNEDKLFGDDDLSQFKNAYGLEMYIKNVDGFEGEGDFLSKFGVEVKDEITFTVSRRRFSEEVPEVKSTEELGKPVEGDLIFLPLTKKIYEIRHVEHEAIFYQMGSLQTYDLVCELFTFDDDEIDTGVSEIDKFNDELSKDINDDEILLEAGERLTLEDGGSIISESFSLSEAVPDSDNEYIEKEAKKNQVFDDANPFADGDW